MGGASNLLQLVGGLSWDQSNPVLYAGSHDFKFGLAFTIWGSLNLV